MRLTENYKFGKTHLSLESVPDFLFKKRYLFLSFNLNDKHRQKKEQFCILFYGK